MKIARFISYLERLGIRLWLDKNQLRYQAPKNALTPVLRAQVIDHKAEIMAFLSRANQLIEHPIQPIAREDNAQFPLSFAQQRLWFLAQLEGASDAYNIPLAFQLEGELDVARLSASWQVICERHETLRTTFPIVDRQARQQINAPAFNLKIFDLSDKSGAQQEAEMAGLLRHEAKRPFDLVNGPLWRVNLLRLSENSHVILIIMHHIITDGWSMGILMQELAVLYAQQAHLPELSVQYADFAVWQREWLSGDLLQQQLDYWKEQLADAPPLLTLPTDHARPAMQRYRGDKLFFTLPKSLHAELVSLSAQNSTTLFMTLQAAFAVLLSRYSGQEDILIGSPIANREVAEIEHIIGFFVNTLVLRNDLSDFEDTPLTFRDFLSRVRQVALDGYQHQALPFELLVETLQPERSLSYSPLFQAVFVLQNNRQEALSFSGLTVSAIEVEYPVATFDLTLTMQEGLREEGLMAWWQYNTDLFERATIERMAGHFQILLEGIVANPDQPIAHLPLLSEREKHQLLVEWNDSPESPSPLELGEIKIKGGACIHKIFEEQAERTPEAIAVIFDDQQLTYHELNTRANQLAHYLIAQGVGEGAGASHVGLYVERGIEMVVGVLAILKAGGAYVPIDTAYPHSRIEFMLQDSKAALLLTQEHLLAQLPFPLASKSGAQPICFTREAEQIGQQPDSNPVTPVTADHLAYIIYTSGSSGRPKGVMVTHANVTRLFTATERYYDFDQRDVWTLFHSIAFDFSVWEVWGALLYGGRLVVVPYMVSRDPDAFYDLLCQEQVTVLNQTPSAFRALIAAEERVGVSSDLALRLVIFGGEALELASLKPWVERHGATPQLVNMYGITETTVHVTYRPLTEADLDSTASYIGRPIADLDLYILDQHLQAVPIGVPGELCVGGAGVSQGYLNRPELTKERFIDHPFARGGKLYRSGDQARYLANGDIEYLGRYDDQVKIRGFRIELGEIEAQLSQHESVREVVVVVRSELSGKRLVAYFVAEEPIRSSTLRAHLGQKLPDYMIPKAFVQLEAMPLTTNGKIDRRALPAPELSVDSAQLLLPRTPTEEILATIWQQVLTIEQVGVTDNFFEVGGDSIISIQIVSRAKEAGIQISTRDLFQHQTISELASALAARAKVRDVQKTDAEQGIVTGSLPLTPIQHWFLEQKWQEPHHFNQSVLLELTEDVNPTWLSEAVRALLTHHDALRLRFEPEREGEGDRWQQMIVAPEPDVPFEVIDLSTLKPSEQVATQEKLANELQTSLNLSQGPLLRVALFQRSTANHLLIVIHHLAVDGVSWRILLEDLERAYQQVASGQSIQLPAKSTYFKQWAMLLNQKGPSALQAERDEWAQLSATPPLPVDHRLGPNDNASAAHISTRLTRAQTEALLNEVPAVYHTQINDLLLTALLLAVNSWTGEAALLLNLEGHGREELFEVDLSRTVGWFTSIFPVRLELTASDLGETIKRVKEQLRTIPNRGIGYGILRYLHPKGMISDLELPEVEAQVSFNYLGQFDQIVSGTLINALATGSSGIPHSPLGSRTHLLDINSMVIKGQLQVDWTYSRNFYRAETIQQLANRFIDALQALIAHCQEPEAGGYTPSDFPDVELNQEELDNLLSGGKKGIEAIYPLSGMQQGMLFHSLLAPQSGAYFEQIVITLEGKLDTQAFKEAWQQVVARHPVLRTYFVWQQLQKPLQLVRQEVELPWSTQDWRLLEDKEKQLELYLAAEREQGFELDRVPLMRFALMQISDERYYFVWNHHHLLLDGWSTPLLQQEVWNAYRAACRGERHDIARPRPYKDYIAWLGEQDLAQAEAYWRQALQGFTAPTPLVVDHRAHLNNDDHNQATYSDHEVYLSKETSAALQKLARENRLTINTLIQGAWALLLSRYNGEEDVLFGATVSGRPAELSGVEKMVGLFINTLPVRVLIKTDVPLLTWLSDLQEQQREREQYAYSLLVDIQGWSDVPRGTPLFESLLVYENYPVAKENNDDSVLQITGVRSVEQTNYPLTLVAANVEKEDGTQLYLGISYNRSRFEQHTISRMVGHLETLLSGIVANPHQPIETLPWLREAEKDQLLIEWNNTQTDYPSDKCLHKIFEEQAARTPEAIAVVFGDQAVTYRELNAKANQLAHTLIAQGVGPDVLVGICVERSLEMVVGLFGILKAGGAYVPLDPTYPPERLAFMLEDAQVPVLLTQERFVATLPQANKLCLDQEWLYENQPESNPLTRINKNHLAYCIYTSGSTGRPKGAMNAHEGIYNRLLWMQEAYQLSSSDRILQKTPFTFDVSVWEFFWPLMFGARLVVARPEGHKDPQYLVDVINQEQITTLHFVPSMLQVFIEAEELDRVTSLKRVICSGEALPVPLMQRFFERVNAPLHNLYGPTEAAIDVTYWECDPSSPIVPIGRPVANTQLYILDSRLQPVPILVPGELHLGGVQVARGYLNRPQLTNEKFIPNPFGPAACGSRLYKTGDLCRYLPDGNVEFLGRADYQVKIRGFRIELGEIEAQLSQHELVREVVVVVRSEPSGERLVAYFVAKEPIGSNTLRAYLGEKLPDYMIPSAFVPLDAMPLTSNGKINRRALPTAEIEIDSAELVLPRTPTEKILAAIWQDVLGIKQIGIHNNFFEIGGHSLLVMQVVARIRQSLQVELPLRHLFRALTIAELAEAVEKIKVSQEIQQSVEARMTTREEIAI